MGSHTHIERGKCSTVLYAHETEHVHFVRGKIVILIEAKYRKIGKKCAIMYWLLTNLQPLRFIPRFFTRQQCSDNNQISIKRKTSRRQYICVHFDTKFAVILLL